MTMSEHGGVGTFQENALCRKVKHKCTWGGVGTFEENAQCRNTSAHGGTVEDTFENTQWRKVKHECTLGAWASDISCLAR